MSRITTIALLALLVSVAAADEFDQAAYNAAVLKHAACTETAAVELAKKNGEASDLALEALQACKVEEAEIAKVAPPEIFQRVLRNVRYMRIRTILETRAGPDPNRCGDCGFLRRWEWDERLRVWRQQGR